MSAISGIKLSITTDKQMQKANSLMELVMDIVRKIEEIDESITSLAEGGIEGRAVDAATRAYKQNRDVINDFVKRFSATAALIYEASDLSKKKTDEAVNAAIGTLK